MFSQTIKAAKGAIDVLNGNVEGVARAINSGMPGWDIEQVLDDFREGDIDVLAAPRLLDEGIDVPSADLAIILSSSKTKRQMIQRMGRVLRKKENDAIAKIIIIYAIDTTEDPELGAHEDFMEDVIEVADDIQYFTYENIEDLSAYLTN
jgi:RNA polymerase primary sigma factor